MTKTFTLTIELGNDAMRYAEDVQEAISKSIWHTADWNSELQGSGAIYDANGNTVGQWAVTEKTTRKPFFVTIHERNRRFATLDEAKAFTQRYYDLTGNILGIGEDKS